jgi:hypothetical protein
MQFTMTKQMMSMSKPTLALSLSAMLVGSTWMVGASAQNLTVTPDQQATATQVAQAGVALSELSPNAPANYTIKRGDTLWAISGMFLKSPWRWPELWGMNMTDIKNPHLIYPGQQLFLETKDGRARLRMGQSGATDGPPTDTVRVSPRTRYETLADSVIPTLNTALIEPFLAEPIIVDETGLTAAPRIVAAAQEGRVLLARGDRAYARGQTATPMLDNTGKTQDFRVFRNATPLKDPVTGTVLGYEAQYVGKATLVRGESSQSVVERDGKTRTDNVPATIDIIGAKEEMRVGDRLLPEPVREFATYTPHAPTGKVEGQIVSVYGSAVVNASQNQVVVINRGSQDGMERGHVMAIMRDGLRMIDKTDPTKPEMKLPDERNGLLMVFRTFDRLSYALVLDITDGVRVGDRLTSPR